jgi:endonuclease YncB( thermonuclease family)
VSYGRDERERCIIYLVSFHKTLTAAVLTAAAVVGGTLAYTNLKFVSPYEQVYKIADGDTFILATNKQAVRLYGIDAPELTNCYGPESTARLIALLKKGKVQLKEPVVDHFGRIVALVYIDGTLINETMIKEGFAAYMSEPGSGQKQMLAAHNYAESHQLGIYSSACTDVAHSNPKCVIKGNHDLDRDQNVYLTPDCPYYSQVTIRRFEGDRWFCSAKEAIAAGFTISPACSIGTSHI